jgi:hypothetical protein
MPQRCEQSTVSEVCSWRRALCRGGRGMRACGPRVPYRLPRHQPAPDPGTALTARGRPRHGRRAGGMPYPTLS